MMTDNGSDWIKQASESAALSFWHSYCEKKMELEDANDRIEQLTSGPGGIMEMKQTIADKENYIFRLESALRLAKEMIIANGLNIPRTMEIIDNVLEINRDG